MIENSEVGVRFKLTALSVLSDLARAAVLKGQRGEDMTAAEQQTMMNATWAACELGATPDEVAATLRASWEDLT